LADIPQKPVAPKPAGSPRYMLIAAVMAAVLVLAAGGLVGLALWGSPKDGPGSFLAGSIGGPFRLVDQDGKPFTDADLKGKWHLVFFGFTHCDDTCPTTLNEMSQALDQLSGKQRADVRIVFITVDPWRDTPQVLKSYVAKFAGPIVGLTGSGDQVKQAEAAYRVYSAKHPLPGGGYDMDHSALIYVMDPEGRFTATLSIESQADEMAARLRQLLS
jgi:protein SCO1